MKKEKKTYTCTPEEIVLHKYNNKKDIRDTHGKLKQALKVYINYVSKENPRFIKDKHFCSFYGIEKRKLLKLLERFINGYSVTNLAKFGYLNSLEEGQ